MFCIVFVTLLVFSRPNISMNNNHFDRLLNKKINTVELFNRKNDVSIKNVIEFNFKDYSLKFKDENVVCSYKMNEFSEYLFVLFKAENVSGELIDVQSNIYSLDDFTELKMAEIASERLFEVVASEVVYDAKKNGLSGLGSDFAYSLEFILAVTPDNAKNADYYLENRTLEVYYRQEYEDSEVVIDADVLLEDDDYILKENEDLLKRSYRLRHYVDANRQMIAITFDDGPVKGNTDRAVNLLNKYNGLSTFFMVGEQMVKSQNVIADLIDDGHEIGSHTYSHPALAKKGVDISWEIYEVQNILNNTSNRSYEVKYLRPPYGSYNKNVLEISTYPLIMWSLDTLDWKTRDPQASYDAIMENVQDGDIVLLHDLHVPSVDALEMVLPSLIESGYQIVTVSELLEARKQILNQGDIIYSVKKGN